MQERHPTAQRILEAGLKLFADHGVAGTPVVRVEEAAGLAPSSGGFYRYFRSKAELLEVAVDDAAASQIAADQLSLLETLPLADQARLIAMGAWAFFDNHRDLVIVLTRDPMLRPSNYTHAANGFPGNGVAFVAAWLQDLDDRGELAEIEDAEAMALVLVDALTNYWLQREAEDATPYGVNGERFITAWTRLVLSLAAPRSRSRRS